jgi:trimethylamine monooxygenase
MENPKLFYLGMQAQLLSFPRFSVQTYYVRDVILNKLQIPTTTQARLDADAPYRLAESRIQSKVDAFNFNGRYLKELMSLTDHPHMKFDEIIATFFSWMKDKKDDVMTFR